MGTSKTGNYRWVICALLFFATTLNYLDRTIIGLLKDDIGAQFGWSESDYSNIVVCFQVAYALGLLGAGWLVDKLGTKLGYFFSVCVWSIATILHGFARGTFGFAAARSLLGLSEAGNFPAANKTVAEWFPLKERALATGIYNSGVTWEVTGTGALSSGTAINSNGLLTVASNETNTSLTVKATSIQDDSVTNSTTVTVTA